ncbi:lytic tail protein [Pseudomonas phage WP1]
MGKVAEMTTAELQSRVQGESNIQKFNDALANLNQTFTTLENRVGEKLAPAFTKLIEIIDKIVQAIPNEVESFAKDTKSRWEDGVLGKATAGDDILSLLSPGALLSRLAAVGDSSRHGRIRAHRQGQGSRRSNQRRPGQETRRPGQGY